ncbi:MAG: class I SAM-dependent methyltransferase [Saprospiraceae bacterium]|nr:class I SAM-dependent methyltransferase [Saprospiraceae bacterium]
MKASGKQIGAAHDFHDQVYARDWARRYTDHRHRNVLFQDIVTLLSDNIQPGDKVLELGIGPGLLTGYILNSMPDIEYLGLDFSQEMLTLAEARLNNFGPRFRTVQADLTDDQFFATVGLKVAAVVTCWTLHDLGTSDAIRKVYSACRKILQGCLINADFIKPAGTSYDYEHGRIGIKEHLGMLRDLGYINVSMVQQYEKNLKQPTAANNYACFFAKYGAK